MKTLDCDYLVIGAGLAGLSAAMELAPYGHVILCSKLTLLESNSSRAQGGIAVPVAEGDTIEAHLQDTLVAGAGLTNAEVAREIIAAGPARIAALERWGVPFAMAAGRSLAPATHCTWSVERGGHWRSTRWTASSRP